MTESVLLVEKKGGVATLTLNRPDQMNALSLELRWALQEVLTELRTDDDVGIIILTGAGKGFCAGLDLKEMGSSSRDQSPQPSDPPSLMRAVNKPIIGAINGVAITGGFEISLSCDLLVVTPETRFADTHARVGLIAGWGLGARLSRAVGLARAKELSLTGNFLTAETAYEWGLVNRIVAAEDLLPTCHSLAQDMLSCVPEVMNEYKRQIDHAYDLALGDAMTYEVDICRRHRSPPAEVVAERRLLVQERARGKLKEL
ncbi:MAG: enoyl-CoA hydratase [Pseudomonadales bacterium]|nr:enoyl-CoA hydratase [Pseudomonadales bacterium]